MKKEARMERSETHRPYSWWWDSHRPKNSKWIQENLADMDMKIKAMLKLIEQDADSFAQRAEMYYKKRPELVQLVEEFYRAYRALAERCDHITGELRQIHHSISEAFPNELRMINSDAARDGQSPDETDEARDASRLQGLKHLSEIFAEYGTTEQKLSELREELKNVQEQNQKIKEEWTSQVDEINDLKGKIESLQNRNEELNQQGHLLNEKLQNETEEREKLKAEIVTYENLQSNLTLKEEENKKLQSELLSRDLKIKDIEERVSSVEKEKDVLQQEMEKIITKMSSLAEELTTSRSQEQRLRSRLQEETNQTKNLEAALTSYQESLNDSQEQQRVLTEEIKAGTERLKETDKRVKLLEEEIVRLQAENANLIERVSSATASIRNLEDEVLKLKHDKNNLLREVAFRVDQNNDLQKKLYGLQEEKNDVDHRYQTVLQQLASVGLDAGSFHSCYISLQEDNQKLKELIKEHQDGNVRMGSNIHDLEEKLQEKNRDCEHLVLSHAEEVHRLNSELEKQQSLCENLQNQISDLLSEKIKSSEQTNVLEANLHDFKEKLVVLEGENLKLSAELVSSFDHAKHLNDELNTLQVEKEKCEQEIRARDTMMSNLEIEASSLQAEVDSIKLKLQEELENAKESELELGRLKELLSEIESKNIKLTDECQQLAHENTIIKLRVKELEWEIHVKQEEKAALSNELTSELKESSELKEELKKLQHLLSLSENETDDAGMEARSVVNAIVEKVKQLQSNFFDSENENERLSIAATSLSSYLEKLELQMAALQSEKASVSAEAESSSSLLEQSQKEIRLLQKTTDELRIEMQYSLEREACLEKEIGDLKHSLVGSQDEQLLLHAQHQEILEEYYSLKKKFGDLELRLSRSEEESFNDLSEALANTIFSTVLESRITEREIQMQKLLELVTDIRKEREVHEDQLQEAVGNSKLLGDEILQLKRLVLVLQEDKKHTEKLQEESDNLKDQNSELCLKVDGLEHAVEEKDRIIVGLGHKLEEIQEKHETLSRELELRQQEQMAGQVFLKELELQLASSSNQVNNLKEELSTASKNNIIMEEKLQDMAKEMEVKDEELSCSHGRERILTSDLKKLHEREENVRIELQSLVEQNKLLESEIEKMYAALQLKQMEITLLKDGNEKIYDLCRLLATKSMDTPGGHHSTQQDKVKERIDVDDKVLLRNELARIIIGMQSENNNNDMLEKFARILGLLLPMKDDICCLKEEVLGQINALRKDARAIQDFFEQLLEANCELSAEAETRAQDVIRLQAEVDAIQHILIEMKRKNQNLQDESQRIIKELWNVKARLQSVLNRNIHLESQNRSLKAELHQQTQKAFQMQEDRSVAENESNLRSTELETLKSELKIAKDLESSSLRLCEMLLGQTAEVTSINPESFQAAEERLRKLYDELLQLRNENENLKNDAYLRFLSRSREMQHEGYQNESDSIAMELLKEKCSRLETQVEKLSENAAKFETKSYEAQVLAMKLEEMQQAMSSTQQFQMQIQGLQARVKSLRKENVRLKSELKGELTSSRSLKYKDGLNNKDVDADEEPPLLQEEKEVVVDESKKVASQEHASQELDTLLDENRKYWNRVGFSTKQIQNLQSSVQELQLKLKSLKGNKKLKGEKWGGLDMNLLEKQLRELQGQVMQLVDHNNKLKKDVKFGFAWANSVQDAGGQDRKLKVDEEVPILCRQNSKIAERLDISADKARIMEMEVQRIRLLLSRFQVQQKPVVDDGARMRVPLRAFLVGGKKDQQSKKHGCCTRPETVE